jgi:small nuclear ribonucleoprotein (snRNP)-like protein
VFEAWLADLRVVEAVRSRARTAWLGRQAAEEATFVGVLADLAERGRQVVVETANGGRHRGRLAIVGDDYCALRTSHQVVVIRHLAVTAVRPLPQDAGTVGDRVVAPTSRLRDALSAWAGTGVRVRVERRDGAGVVGELRAIGEDVMTLRLDDRREVYVPLISLDELSVLESG